MVITEDLARLELTIGPVARLVGCSPAWVRQLEEAGVIAKAPRTQDGRRLYRLADVETIRRTIAASREARRAGASA